MYLALAKKVNLKMIIGVIVALIIVVLGGSQIWAMIQRWRYINESAQGGSELKEVARILSHHLGTNKSLGWFEGWDEDEDGVLREIRVLTMEEFKAVERHYTKIYTNKHALRDDLLKYIDVRELEMAFEEMAENSGYKKAKRIQKQLEKKVTRQELTIEKQNEEIADLNVVSNVVERDVDDEISDVEDDVDDEIRDVEDEPTPINPRGN